MADHALRRSPLDAYADRLDAAGGETGLVSLAELPFRRQLTIRVAPGGAAAAAVERGLGVALPGAPCSAVGRDGLDVLWMGPDEWLVVADECPAPAQLEAAAGPGATVVDVS